MDSYAVDYVILGGPGHWPDASDNRAATEFFERVCRAGSQRAKTPGSGAGIRTQADGLLGDGVSLDSTLVHYGVQVERKVQPDQPEVIWPRQERQGGKVRRSRIRLLGRHGRASSQACCTVCAGVARALCVSSSADSTYSRWPADSMEHRLAGFRLCPS